MSKKDKPKTFNYLREMCGLPRIESEIKYNDYWERVYEKDKEIEKLKSIIKEVREYIEKRKDTQKWRKESLKEKSTNIDIVLEHYRDILEILEKENK